VQKRFASHFHCLYTPALQQPHLVSKTRSRSLSRVHGRAPLINLVWLGWWRRVTRRSSTTYTTINSAMIKACHRVRIACLSTYSDLY